MLTHLQIENLAIIQSVTLKLGQGLTIITGETGSGKSLLLDGLALLFGGKQPAKTILRQPGDTIRLHAEWMLTPHLSQLLTTHNLPVSNPTVITRELSARQSRASVNGMAVEKDLLAQLGQALLDIHNQHELTDLFQPAYQLQCLDGLAGEAHQLTLQLYRSAYTLWQSARTELAEFQARWQQQQHMVNLWQSQLTELEKAQLDNPEEDVTLKSQLERLSSLQNLRETLQEATQRCRSTEQPDYPGICEHLLQLERLLKTAIPWDARLETTLTTVQQLSEQAQELSHALSQHLFNVDINPDELDRMSNRYSQLERLKRKTGKSLPQLKDWQTQLSEQLAGLSDPEGYLEELQQAAAEAEASVQALSDQLSAKRLQLAEQLEISLNDTLTRLALPNARLSVQLNQQSLSATGQDAVTFVFSANRGQPLRPLAKVASGGELSRVLFALKCHLAKTLGYELLVFDEIDTGMSGEAVKSVAQALSQLAHDVQVVAITHQPIVAAMGDAHWHVEKRQYDQTTEVILTQLTQKEKRLDVLSRLASGIDTDDEAVEKFIDRLLHHAGAWKDLKKA